MAKWRLYQTIAEHPVVPPPPAVPTVDTWVFEMPMRPKPVRSLAAFAATIFFAETPAAPAVPTVDSWEFQGPQIRHLPWRIHVDTGERTEVPAAPAVIPIDRWLPVEPFIQHPKARPTPQDFEVPRVVAAPVPPVDRWAFQFIRVQWPEKRQVFSTVFEPLFPVPAGATYTTYGGPFLYTAANWDAALEFFLEVFFKATVGTVRARLWNDTDALPVSGSDLSTASATNVRLRSGAVALTDGKVYFVQFGKDAGASGTFRTGKLIAV